MRTGLPRLAILLPVLVSAAPALAQPAASTVRNVPDAAPGCEPAAAPDTVVVCGRSDEQHRLPQQEGFDPSGTVMSVPLEQAAGPGRHRHRLLFDRRPGRLDRL